MGIRVHKFLGYGLTDLKPGDPRVNWDCWLLHWEPREIAEYETWLAERERYTLDLGWLKHDGYGGKPRDLCDCIAWSPEFGLPEVLALQPIGCPDWYRFDDSIDYMEETYPWSDDSQKNRVKVYEHGPHPFNASYMDARDGRVLPAEIMTWWRLVNDAKDGEEKATAQDIFAATCGFASSAEAAENVAPKVPEEIRDLAEFADLFTDDGTWRQLRPLLYTYWA